MAEPFSTAAAGIALIANLKSLYDYLREVKNAIGSVHNDVDLLETEVLTMHDLCECVRKIRDRHRQQSSLDTEQAQQWAGLNRPLDDMGIALRIFDSKLRKVYGNDPQGSSWRESYKKWQRFRDVQPALNTLRSTISDSREKLVLWMQSISMNKLDSAYLDIMAKLVDLEKVNNSARASPLAEKKNKHFAIPKAVESHYLGREAELDTLAKALWAKSSTGHRQQKRYVVHGVGGSGKTQFCGKYAEEFRESYWGVFWIDGASVDRLKDSLTTNVADKGGVGKNYEAARDWLSNQNEDWLLIIDNADDPDVALLEFFPQGTNGHVLITTRNQDCAFGNIGSLRFGEMQECEANTLFFKVANITDDAVNKSYVSKILRELGYLALAIVVAGSAIRQGCCKLKSYLEYLDRKWRGRRTRREKLKPGQSSEHEREGKVEALFDVSLSDIKEREIRAIEKNDKDDEIAAKDAPELLRTFAFMHREQVRYEFLKLCAENEKKEQAMESAEPEDPSAPPQTWSQYFFNKLVWLCSGPATPATLPSILRQARAHGKLDEDRLRRAMKYLRDYSLVTHDEETDSWSMHPLIQRWAREGYEFNTGEQHVWCTAAATLVSSCIILTDNSDGSEELMRQLLPHVSEVKERQQKLTTRIEEARWSRDKWFPVMDWGVKPHLLLMHAKFSKVYVSCGLYDEANVLQRVVHRALESLRGYENSKTRRMTIYWAHTLYSLGYADEQATILEKLLDNCCRIFGSNHRETHVASIKLAEARLAQGRVQEARKLCDDAVPGLERQCGLDHEETLNAMNTHAVAILLTGKQGAVARAKALHRRTWEARERLLGPEHVDTLNSRQMFYADTFWDGDRSEHLEAEKGMKEIIELMKKKLGREHPLTLLSMLYLARVKVELRDFDGAQELFDYGLPRAIRHLHENHMAVLFCRYHIGRMRVRQGRWREARDELLDVSTRQKRALQGWGEYHYDRIGSLLELARAHHELGEHDQCDAAVNDALAGFQRITSSEHPWQARLLADWESWKKQRGCALEVRRDSIFLTL
ncbi:hypothetical protein N0V91_009621 [Didymella pomorum]|uniref:NB-ARC domain-containing protein n=1 Tax=Didymella pomorum TaxID=749634 RepID=A0A9W8Z940_9PLEO|nr:hypothetical protein N0V91_009621 [Didymella pomorum]